MIEDKDEILEAIRKLVIDIGYDFFYKGCKSREHEEVLEFGIPLKDEDNIELLFEVAIGSRHLRITCGDKDNPEYFKVRSEMLDFIEECLRTRNKIA